MMPWNYWLFPAMPWLIATQVPAMMWASAFAAWMPSQPVSAEIIPFPAQRLRRRA